MNTHSSVPQWSPPVEGGKSGHQPVLDDVSGLAAMEPASRRREKYLIGRGDFDAAFAAMEPASRRREKRAAGYGEPVGDGAAMEPASRRREKPSSPAPGHSPAARRNGARQ